MKHFLVSLFLLSIFTGCSAVYRGYEGMPLNENEIAVLEHINPMHSNFILEDIDGKFRGLGLISRYELLPGEHSISCTYHNPLIEGGKLTIYFKAEAGKKYIAQAGKNSSRWTIRIIEKDTNKVVSYAKAESTQGTFRFRY